MRMSEITDEPTWRCPQNPFIGALGIQEPVIPGEPLIKRQPMALGLMLTFEEDSLEIGLQHRDSCEMHEIHVIDAPHKNERRTVSKGTQRLTTIKIKNPEPKD